MKGSRPFLHQAQSAKVLCHGLEICDSDITPDEGERGLKTGQERKGREREREGKGNVGMS